MKKGRLRAARCLPWTAGKEGCSGWGGSKTKESWKPPDYRTYRLSPGEALFFGLRGAALSAGIAWLFYRSAWALLPLSPLVALSLMAGRNQRREERKRQLAVQFREGLTALCAALSAGYSVENATAEAARELRSMYGEEGLMVREMELLSRKIRMNCPVETAFAELAERSGLEDIRQLADVFAIAKRSGGDLVKILGKTAGILRTRSQLREEILTLMAGKRLEQRIMSVMPAAVLLYVNLGNPGFTDPLYQGLGGRCIMSGCLAVFWGSRIVNGALREGV